MGDDNTYQILQDRFNPEEDDGDFSPVGTLLWDVSDGNCNWLVSARSHAEALHVANQFGLFDCVQIDDEVSVMQLSEKRARQRSFHDDEVKRPEGWSAWDQWLTDPSVGLVGSSEF